MPPWYIEKDIGIQQYKDDPSLSEVEIAKIAKWADSGAPQGNPADLPPAKQFEDASSWSIGTPDLIVRTKDIVVKAGAPDWWGEIGSVPIGLTEDRYVLALQFREVNDVPKEGTGRGTVGGHYVFHHLIWSTRVAGPDGNVDTSPDVGIDQTNTTSWPVHEVGRNADFFDPKGAPILRANSWAVSNSAPDSTTATIRRAQAEGQPVVNPAYVPPRQGTVGKRVGLHLKWFVYRGPGKVGIEPPQIKAWEDTRTGANSPWAPLFVMPPVPADGKWVAQSTFDEPGTYVLRARADDGALTSDSDVTVAVVK